MARHRRSPDSGISPRTAYGGGPFQRHKNRSFRLLESYRQVQSGEARADDDDVMVGLLTHDRSQLDTGLPAATSPMSSHPEQLQPTGVAV
jgi:hypothetical protein